jgi:hypothetical protein
MRTLGRLRVTGDSPHSAFHIETNDVRRGAMRWPHIHCSIQSMSVPAPGCCPDQLRLACRRAPLAGMRTPSPHEACDRLSLLQ